MNPLYQSKLEYFGTRACTWGSCIAMFLYSELSAHWPQSDQEWLLLALKLTPYALGVAVSAKGANTVVK